ncbi:arylformamidase [Thermomonospora echinospora]|uniref:Arylformamidase n=1 Tax=Thermomonospora echinospora TaxID=1992 RepID=A0A1H6DG95_9ACTN|nr:alpha/beta hydrolase [Thermomonospora echinospora]SEG83626.1 arylformamidase [Thermomonospora echinospora]
MSVSPPDMAVREELDREYSPSLCARDAAATLARYAADSAEARRGLDCRPDIPYGPSPDERLHLFPPPRPDAPLLVFVHGGHWQESSKEDACFAAPAMVEAGAGYVALGYGLAPRRRLGEMVASVRRGLHWVREHAAEFGGCADAVHVAGSSAGAHLAAMAIAEVRVLADPRPPAEVAGAYLLSGVYDLEPIRRCYVNDALGLDDGAAADLSPVRWLPLRAGEVLVARGEAETRAYARQHALMVMALRAAGQRAADLVAPGRDHFELPLDLGVPGTPLGREVLRRMGLHGRRGT